jgi:hypothetical protein
MAEHTDEGQCHYCGNLTQVHLIAVETTQTSHMEYWACQACERTMQSEIHQDRIDHPVPDGYEPLEI